MKLLLPVSVILFFFVSISGTGLTSCNKTAKPDTVTVTKVDTLAQLDTVYCLKCGLVAYYNFNNGNLNDSSGLNNNIIFNNATPTADRNGIANNAYLFDGATSYMEVANSTSLNPNSITIYIILKVNGFYYGTDHGNIVLVKGYDATDGQYIMEFSDFNNPNPYSVPDSTQEIFLGAYGDNTSNGLSAAARNNSYVTPGTWFKMAYTYDGVSAKLYMNGVLTADSTKTVPFTPNTMNLEIGRNNFPGGVLYRNWFNGAIDEIRIYNQALCPGAVAQLSSQPN